MSSQESKAVNETPADQLAQVAACWITSRKIWVCKKLNGPVNALTPSGQRCALLLFILLFFSLLMLAVWLLPGGAMKISGPPVSGHLGQASLMPKGSADTTRVK